MNPKQTIAAVAAIAFLAGCATNPQPATVQSDGEVERLRIHAAQLIEVKRLLKAGEFLDAKHLVMAGRFRNADIDRTDDDITRLYFHKAHLSYLKRLLIADKNWTAKQTLDTGRVQITEGGVWERSIAEVLLVRGHDCEGVIYGHLIDRGDRIDAEVSCRAGKFNLQGLTLE